jgi:DNA-binding GntR family transcriptional regulator
MVGNGLRQMMTVAGRRVRSTAMEDPRLYVRIADSIRATIESGELRPGEPVPSITTLTQEHGVARQTAAKALKVLADEVVIRQWPGLGYFVV